jgi:phosphonoacetaldehyde hydrolase
MTNTHYTRPLQGVILDWAGTTVDYGCLAPTVVFIEMFAQEGVEIVQAEVRTPMGTYKRDHIRAITEMSAVAARWQAVQGRLPDDNDVQRLFEAFIPRQMEVIAAYADLIPGVVEAIAAFRAQGLKIGSTTGYTRSMMNILLPEAQKRGYAPASLVCPDDVSSGRPAPYMIYQNAINLKVYPMVALVKIGDTVSDIEEGINAGTWTIGLAKTGNELGLNEAEVNALPPGELDMRLQAIYEKLTAAGAHYVVDSLADTPPILEEINARLAQGEKPY